MVPGPDSLILKPVRANLNSNDSNNSNKKKSWSQLFKTCLINEGDPGGVPPPAHLGDKIPRLSWDIGQGATSGSIVFPHAAGNHLLCTHAHHQRDFRAARAAELGRNGCEHRRPILGGELPRVPAQQQLRRYDAATPDVHLASVLGGHLGGRVGAGPAGRV